MTAILAYLDVDGSPRRVGTAYANVRRGQLSSTFTYDPGYLGRPDAYPIDPSHTLAGGSWPRVRGLPRAFDDAAPDRWGRNLIAKRRRLESSASRGPMPQLDDSDYLLGVSDLTRQGALRFKVDTDGDFQHPAADVPKLLALPALRHAAEQVARDGPHDDSAVKVLLDAGTGSLGGARPKASVRDGDRLLMAKFGHPEDGWNVMAWEKTASDLALAAGISVPPSQLLEVDGHAVLLIERFDRRQEARLGYISAMTLLEAADGETRDYVELAEAIPGHSAEPSADLRQLWRRIAFSIAVHNTDDHLRNHGFLRHRSGWRIAPAFDVNPNPEAGARRVTSIGGAGDAVAEVESLLGYASTFGLTTVEARATLHAVAEAVSGWQSAARSNGISAAEISRFAPVITEALKIITNT